MLLELPHTSGCLVCGRENAHGLRLSLHVRRDSGVVSVEFVPEARHIGFEGVVHGGALATVLDEAMVWAATWHGRRFCLCGEFTVRFRHSAAVGQRLRIEARVADARPRLLLTSADVRRDDGTIIASATGKYVPLDAHRNARFMATLLDESATAEAGAFLKGINHEHAQRTGRT